MSCVACVQLRFDFIFRRAQIGDQKPVKACTKIGPSPGRLGVVELSLLPLRVLALLLVLYWAVDQVGSLLAFVGTATTQRPLPTGRDRRGG